MINDFKKSGQQLLDLLFPPFCVICKRYGKLICLSCEKSIHINKQSGEGKTLAAANYKQREVFKIITSLKYDLIKDLDFYCAQIMFEFLLQNNIKFTDDWIITYVPMHKTKQQLRTFNQSQLIAEKLSILLELPCFSLLIKNKRTPSQMTLKREERLKNLKGAFESFGCEGKKVLLIDDVFTTGTTLKECRVALRQAGASEVCCFAFCKD